MRKRLWSPEEDEKLQKYVSQHGFSNWSEVAKKTGLQRCGKSCRLRWINYLRPDLKRGKLSCEEKIFIVHLQKVFGNSWSKIAAHLPGRTDNDIKNFWHSHFRKKCANILPSFPLLNPNSFSSFFPSSSSYHLLHHHPFFSPPLDSISQNPQSSISSNPKFSIVKNPNYSLAPTTDPRHASVAPFSTTSNIPNLINVTHNGLYSKEENNSMQIANHHLSSILQQPIIQEDDIDHAMDMYTSKQEEQDHQNQEGFIGLNFELMGSLCHHAAPWYNGNKVRDRITRSAMTHECNNMDMKAMQNTMMGNSCTSSTNTKVHDGTLQMHMHEDMKAMESIMMGNSCTTSTSTKVHDGIIQMHMHEASLHNDMVHAELFLLP